MGSYHRKDASESLRGLLQNIFLVLLSIDLNIDYWHRKAIGAGLVYDFSLQVDDLLPVICISRHG